MGMFDTFIVEYKGRELEIQTKRFGSNMDEWRIGDVVEGSPVGIHTYYETVWADSEGNIKHTKDVTSIEIYITLASFVFVDAIVVVKEKESEKKDILITIGSLNSKWSDTNTFINFAVGQLFKKQQQIKKLDNIITSTLADIKYWKRDHTKEESTHYVLRSITKLHHGEFLKLLTDSEFIDALYNKIEKNKNIQVITTTLEIESELEQYKL
jgi:hypothetical protein